MPYDPVRGSRIRSIESKPSKGPCARCGRIRTIGGGGGKRILCRDCVSVLTEEELDLWWGKAS